MKNTLESLCGNLDEIEYSSSIRGRWDSQSDKAFTIINYTFNLNNVPDYFYKYLQKNHDEPVTEAIANSNHEVIKNSLEKWMQACGQFVRFNQVQELPEQKGIVFLSCDNISTYGATFFLNPKNPSFSQVMVCLPPVISDTSAIRAVSHEIGHALGFKHLHEIPALKQRLLTTEQGLGCSVMNYIFDVTNFDSDLNSCKTAEYCLNEEFSLYPGPFDKQLCTTLYKVAPEAVELNLEHCANGLFHGLLNGSVESFLSTLLAELEIQGKSLDKNTAINLAIVSSTLLKNSFLSNGAPLFNTFALLELQARLQGAQHLEIIHQLRIMANVSGLLFSFYQIYMHEDALNKSLYLSGLLATAISGSALGQIAGKYTASLVNSQVQTISNIFSSTSDLIEKIGTKTWNYLPSLRSGFFSKKSNPVDSITNELERNFMQPD